MIRNLIVSREDVFYKPNCFPLWALSGQPGSASTVDASAELIIFRTFIGIHLMTWNIRPRKSDTPASLVWCTGRLDSSVALLTTFKTPLFSYAH